MTTVSRKPIVRFSTRDVVLGSAVTVGAFTVAVTTVIFATFAIIGALALRASWSSPFPIWHSYSGPGDFQPPDATDVVSSALGIFILTAIVAVCVAGFTLIVAAVFGPLAALLAAALRSVPRWPVHALAYSVLGAIASTCLELVAVPLLDYSWANVWTIALCLDVVAAASAAVGWTVSWRVALRRVARVRL